MGHGNSKLKYVLRIRIAVQTVTDYRAEALPRGDDAQFLDILANWNQAFAVRQGETFVFVNRAFALLCGYHTPEEVIALSSSYALVAKGEHERLRDYSDARVRGEEVADCCTLEAMRKDGSRWWAECRVQRVTWKRRPADLIAVNDVSDHKRTENALNDSENRFRDFAESASDWFWETDEYHCFITSAEELVPGATSALESVVGLTRFDLRPADDTDDKKWQRHRADLEAHRPFRDFVYYRRGPNGRAVHARISGKPIFDSEGRFLGYRGTATDITELLKRDVEIRDRDDRLASLVENAAVGIVEVAPNGRYRRVNAKFCDITGYASEELLNLTYVDITHPDDREVDIALNQELLDGETNSFIEEKRYIRKNGDVVWVQLSVAVVRDNLGGPNYTITIVEDITERKNAEAALQTLNEELEDRVSERTVALGRSEERLRVIMDNTVDGIVVINEAGIVESFSHSAAQMFGYKSEEVVGENVSLLMPEPERSRHDGYIRRYLADGEARIIGIGREVSGRRKDGSVFPMEIAVSEVGMDGDRLFTGLVRDITERKKVEQELVAASQAAVAANQAKSEFLSSMSHELRTPLNAIMGYAQLLRDYSEQPLTAEQRAGIEQILDGGQHLLVLINEVLDLSRIESGRVDLSLERVDLTQAIRDGLGLVKPLADKRDVTIVNEADTASKLQVTADPGRLKQVLLNLLSNAVKYNHEKGTVTVGMAVTDTGMVRISITDTGPGIPAEKHDEVFRPFSRLGLETSHIEGSGIGLTISRQLIEAMGGSLDFDSTVGEGSTFWFEVPIAETLASSSVDV